MKILHVTKKYPDALGGDAVVVANLEKQQIKAGHKVTIFTSNCPEIRNNDNVYKFGIKDTPEALDTITPKRLISLIALYFKAFQVFRKERPDVIHSHSIDLAFFISFAARHYKIPIVHTFHIVTFNDPRHQGLRAKLELKLLAGARPAKIYVLNPGDVQDFAAVGFDNAVFIPNGVNVEDWLPLTQLKKNAKFTYIAVGRLEEQKGFVCLIEAAARLMKQHKNFQVQIVGEGSQEAELRSLIAKKKLGKHVHLLGRKSQSEIRELYSKAHVFVLSSLWEGMPLSLLEAWAAGLPSIATTVNSVPHIAKYCAELIPADDIHKLTAAMSKLFDEPEVCKDYARKSLKRVENNHQWSAISSSMYGGLAP